MNGSHHLWHTFGCNKIFDQTSVWRVGRHAGFSIANVWA